MYDHDQPVTEQGQGLMEYAMIIVLVAIVVLAILIFLGPPIGNMYSNVVENWPG